MPWKVEKGHGCPASKPWAVVKQTDGSVEGCHATQADAQKQQAALYANEKRKGEMGMSTAVSQSQRDRARVRHKQLVQAARHLSNEPVPGEGEEKLRHARRRARLVDQLQQLAQESDSFAQGLSRSNRAATLDDVLVAATVAFQRNDRPGGVRALTSATQRVGDLFSTAGKRQARAAKLRKLVELMGRSTSRPELVAKLSRLADRQAGDWDDDPQHLASSVDAVLDEALIEFQEGDTMQGVDLIVAAAATIDALLEAMGATDADETSTPGMIGGAASAGTSPGASTRGLIPSHELADHLDLPEELRHLQERAVDNSAWDGGAAMSNCASKSSPAGCYGSICAGRKAGDAALQSSWALPHHRTPGGPPNAAGVRNSLARLSQTQGLTNRAAAQAHLDAHMKAIQAAAGTKSDDGWHGQTRYGYRSMAVALRQDQKDGLPSRPVMEGNFAVYGEWTEIHDLMEGNFMEQVRYGAFERTFEEDRAQIRVLFQHGRDPMMGSKPIGVVESLEEIEGQGAHYVSPLFRGIPELILEGLDQDQYGASFRFETIRDEWNEKPKPSDHNPRALPERTLLEVRVAEFGPVTFPAYTSASAGLRSRSLTSMFAGPEIAGRPDAGSTGGGKAATRSTAPPLSPSTRARMLALMRPIPKGGVDGT